MSNCKLIDKIDIGCYYTPLQKIKDMVNGKEDLIDWESFITDISPILTEEIISEFKDRIVFKSIQLNRLSVETLHFLLSNWSENLDMSSLRCVNLSTILEFDDIDFDINDITITQDCAKHIDKLTPEVLTKVTRSYKLSTITHNMFNYVSEEILKKIPKETMSFMSKHIHLNETQLFSNDVFGLLDLSVIDPADIGHIDTYYFGRGSGKETLVKFKILQMKNPELFKLFLTSTNDELFENDSIINYALNDNKTFKDVFGVLNCKNKLKLLTFYIINKVLNH